MVNGTQNVLEAARKHGVKKIAAASTASVYGDPSYLPMDEKHPFNNRTLYGAAKIANEQILRAYNEMYGLQYVMFRPFNVYGPRMDVFGAYTEVMIRWLERLGRGEPPIIFGDGLQTMDFVYVEDVAEAYVKAMAVGRQRRGVQLRDRHRDQPARPVQAALRGGRPPGRRAGLRAGPRRQQRRAAAGLHEEGARDGSGSRRGRCCREGLRLLARWHRDLLASTDSGAVAPAASPPPFP